MKLRPKNLRPLSHHCTCGFAHGSSSRMAPRNFALDFLPVHTEDCSTLCTIPMGFTRFACCTPAPLPEVFSLLCSSLELLVLPILLMFSPLHLNDCHYNLGRLLPPQPDITVRVTLIVGRQVSPGKNVDLPCTLAQFTASTLDCSGFVVVCQLAQPHGLTSGSCSSSRSFASGFLQTSLRSDALAFR